MHRLKKTKGDKFMELEAGKSLEKEAVLHCNRDWNGRKFTLAAIFSSELNLYKIGVALFNPNDKNYNKKRGRVIALGRANKNPIITIEKSKILQFRSVSDYLKSIEFEFRKEDLKRVYRFYSKSKNGIND